MHGLLILICIFCDAFASIISFALGTNLSITLYTISAFTFLYSLYLAFSTRYITASSKTMTVFWISLFFVLCVMLSMFVTKLYYDKPSKLFDSMILSFGSKCLMTPFFAIAWNKKDFFYSVVKWIIPYTSFATVCSMIAVIRLAGKSIMDFEIGRQLLSYGGAFSVGLLLFLLQYQNECVKESIKKYIVFILIIFNIYIVFAGGGKGAFVLTCLLFLLYFYSRIKAKVALLIVTFLGALKIFESFFIDIILQTPGGMRILTLFISDDLNQITTGRDRLYAKAVDVILDRCFLGGGPGSAIYDVGYFSHNIFLDILLDWGFIGCVFFLVVIVVVCRKSFALFENPNIRFLFTIFFCQFILLMFSGSFYSYFGFWFSIIAILGYSKEMHCKQIL